VVALLERVPLLCSELLRIALASQESYPLHFASLALGGDPSEQPCSCEARALSCEARAGSCKARGLLTFHLTK